MLYFYFVVVAFVGCEAPKKKVQSNTVVEEIQTLPKEEKVQKQQEENTDSCVQNCLQQRQMEARAIEAITADCEQSCNGEGSAPTLELSSNSEVVEPKTTDELKNAKGQQVRIQGVFEDNEFGKFLMTEQLGNITLRSSDVTWSKDENNTRIEVVGTCRVSDDGTLMVDVKTYKSVE